MKFSASDGTSLVEDVRWRTDTDTSSFPVADITRLMNRWYHKVAIRIWKSSKDFEFDDSNATDLPIATTTLVDGQQDYSLPTTALAINRIEVKDSAGNWVKLSPIDQFSLPNIALEEYMKSDGLPQHYDLIGNSVFLYPKPDSGSVILSGGLKIYLSSEVSEFVSTDTTKEPGFAEPFHGTLSMGVSYDYLMKNGELQKGQTTRQETEQLMQEMEDFYAGRHADSPLRLKSSERRKSYR